MKPFSGCLIAIIVPVGLIWVALFLRDVWIDHTLELQTTLPESFVSEAEYNPDRFEERLLSAFNVLAGEDDYVTCLLYTSPSPRDKRQSRMPSSA